MTYPIRRWGMPDHGNEMTSIIHLMQNVAYIDRGLRIFSQKESFDFLNTLKSN
jgi:hypothetical protein